MRNYALIGVSASDWETMENKISKAEKKRRNGDRVAFQPCKQ